MKIIWLMPECPFPANTGGRVVEWNRIREFAKNNDIYLFVAVDDEYSIKYRSKLKEFCKEVHLYVRKKSLTLLVKSIVYPYPVVSRKFNAMINDIDKCFEKIEADIVMVEFPQMLCNLSEKVKKDAKIIVNQHNIEHLSMISIAEHTTNLLKKNIYKVVAKQLRRYEKKQYKEINVSLYTFVSAIDKDYFEEMYGLQNTLLVPIGADIRELKPAVHSKKISFIAKMSYEPNETGAVWFINNVWDKIIKKIPDAELFLVGKDPSKKLYECSNIQPGITVTGTVDNVEPYYDESVAVIVPIFSGGGVKVKLIEGLGQGKIVITTSKGIEGTEFINNVHVLATDSPKEFVDLCINAINAPERFDPLRIEANQLMKQEYSWSGILGMFEKRIREMLENENTSKKFI